MDEIALSKDVKTKILTGEWTPKWAPSPSAPPTLIAFEGTTDDGTHIAIGKTTGQSAYGGMVFSKMGRMRLTAEDAKGIWDFVHEKVQSEKDVNPKIFFPEGMEPPPPPAEPTPSGPSAGISANRDPKTNQVSVHVSLSKEEQDMALTDVTRLISLGLPSEEALSILSRHYHLGVQHGWRSRART